MITVLTNKPLPEGVARTALAGYALEVLGPRDRLVEKVTHGNFNVILLEGDIELIRTVRLADPRAEVVLFGDDPGLAVEAVRMGASAYLLRPVSPETLGGALACIAQVFDARRRTAELEGMLHEKYTFEGMAVGRNPKMLDAFALLRRIAPYYRAVLITGETGTGKEVMAKVLHAMSPRSREPFLVCNCGGLSESLLGSELFGHVRGAFTGAVMDKQGLFEAAGGGVVFLDEVGELPPSFQPHFLRVLQDGEFRPIGSPHSFRARCTVIAATNRDLSHDVSRGGFRKDLYYRLAPFTIHLPTLKERKDDVPLLCRFFLDRFNERTGRGVQGISRPAQAALMSHDWPGNARELQSVIEQAAMLTPESFVRAEDLPPRLTALARPDSGSAIPPLEEVIARHVREALTLSSGNRSRAAKLLGITRRSLIRRIEKYGVE